MPGPPPNPQSRKQAGSQAHTWTDLPVDGFTGTIPAWPLTTPDTRERAMWRAIWRTPQAAAWSRLGWRHDVAMYVRLMTVAETGDVRAAAEARQWSDRLGLNPTAMLKNRWRVRADEVETRRAATRTVTRTRRLKVVDDAVARP